MKEENIGFAFAIVAALAALAHYLFALDIIVVVCLCVVTATAYSMLKQLPALPWWFASSLAMWWAIG